MRSKRLVHRLCTIYPACCAVVGEPDALRVSFLQIKLHRLGCLFSGWSCSFGDDRGRMKGGVDSRQVALMACGPQM